jgi:hypothetical protein
MGIEWLIQDTSLGGHPHPRDPRWLARTKDGEAFVPTLRGAYLMTWGQLPPVSWVRKLRIGRHAARLLAEVRQSDEVE